MQNGSSWVKQTYLSFLSIDMAQMLLQRRSRLRVACWIESHSASVAQASQSWSSTSHRFNTEATPVLCFSMSLWSSWKCNVYELMSYHVSLNRMVAVLCMKSGLIWACVTIPAADPVFSGSPESHRYHRQLDERAPSQCGPARNAGCSCSYPAAVQQPEFPSVFLSWLCTTGYKSDTRHIQHKWNRLIFLMHKSYRLGRTYTLNNLKLIMNGKRALIFISATCVVLPSTNEVEQVLPAITDFHKFVFNLWRFALMASSD